MEKACSICKVLLTKTDNRNFVSCSKCQLIFHNSCAGVTSRLYEYFIVQKGIPWYCHICNPKIRSESRNNADDCIPSENDKLPLQSDITNNIVESLMNDEAVTNRSREPSTILVSSQQNTCSYVTNLIVTTANYCIGGCFSSK